MEANVSVRINKTPTMGSVVATVETCRAAIDGVSDVAVPSEK
jgi:hypothetical protein